MLAVETPESGKAILATPLKLPQRPARSAASHE